MVEFRSTRLANLGVGLGLLLIAIASIFIGGFGNEEELLASHARKSRIVKAVEQLIGWEAFAFLMILLALWALVYAIVHLWKFIDARPDLQADISRITFHPAVYPGTLPYSEIDHWNIEFVSGNPVLWLHLATPYWSFQGMFKRKTIKLEGDRNQIEPLANFFAGHPVMSGKYTR